jgi:hypothetical protein
MSVVAAGDWLVLFSADESPVTVHVPAATWQRDEQGPVGTLDGPNTVWTGDCLIVWGGQAAPTATDPPAGARWTPPST